jgi:hypothetical protein
LSKGAKRRKSDYEKCKSHNCQSTRFGPNCTTLGRQRALGIEASYRVARKARPERERPNTASKW